MLVLGLCGLLAAAGAARAETKVELKGVHLCCGACVKAVGQIVQKVDGAKATCDRDTKTVTITAPDDATAQKVLNALAAGGFHGDTGNASLTIKDDSGASKEKVKSLTVTGVHNCCPACCKAIKATVEKVSGVTGDTATPKNNTFEVTGDFDAGELVKALNDAGFHVKVKK
jgi:copper chaperone CopZ